LIWFLTLPMPKSSQEEWLSQFSAEDLEKLNAQYDKTNIPTRDTPEQTYAKLKEALKNEDVDAAVECFVEEKRGEWRENLNTIKEKGFMKEMEQDLTELKLELEGDAIMQFSYYTERDGKKYGHFINFIKDSNGDWKIDSL
ncbi:MAG: hypothetical protein V1891_01315, partial [bacterium]